MIEISYEEHDLGEHKKYKNLIKSDYNILHLEGDNGLGKSTFQHAVAFALYAHLNDQLPTNPEARSRMEYKLSDMCEFSFDVKVKDKKHSIECTCLAHLEAST